MIILSTLSLAILIDLVSYLFIFEPGDLLLTVIIISAIIAALPVVVFEYIRYQHVKNLEDRFPQFLIDLVESVRAGMNIPQALKHVSKNDYGPLTPHIRKIAAQVDWGVPLEDALLRFAKRSGSRLIGRMVATIIESHKFGGNLIDIFESISETSLQIERLREERKLYLQSQMTTGYVIFFVFLAVLIGMQRFLIPSLTGISAVKGEKAMKISPEELQAQYRFMFRNLVIIQAVFAGLVVGKMSEGSVMAGIKHSFILFVIGFIVFTVAT